MIENQVFNLEKIKDLTSSIDILEASLHQLTEQTLKAKTWKHSIIESFTEENFLTQITMISEMLITVGNKIQKITKENVSRFLNFQDGLIRKYKEVNQQKLKRLKLDDEALRRIGLNLIENRKISRLIYEISYTPSLEVSQWIEILDSLQQNSIFLKVMNKIKNYHENLIQDKLQLELKKIPKDTEVSLIKEYENAFLEDPELSFKEYLQIIENNLTQQELKEKRRYVKEEKEKEELVKLKKKQEEHKETYDDYLKLSDSEFKRKRRKKSREKLKSITKNTEETKEIEISDEISEKIEKFKSKFNETFEEKYLIQKDDEQDPLDIVRERKRKKEKEYKQYKDHFEED
ncbi:MAG: hypothetical protein ACXAAH_03005 [Promethearchaeota archaeon]|jgi:hypothetical protein